MTPLLPARPGIHVWPDHVDPGRSVAWQIEAEAAAGCYEIEGGALVVPFRTEGALVAALRLGRRESRKGHGGDDRRMLHVLANPGGAVAIQNAITLEKLRLLNRDLEDKVRERTRPLHEKNEILRELSATDTVTGLRNRRFTIEVLERAFERCRRRGGGLGLLMIDLDHFKRVNDTYGHLAGDEVLKQVASLVKGNIHSTDVAGRYGGEELTARGLGWAAVVAGGRVGALRRGCGFAAGRRSV